MILIKKIDVESHFAAKRAMKGTGPMGASRSEAPVLSGAQTVRKKTKAKGFLEDFSAEHSSNTSIPPSI
jgi:hypothetical protein